MHDQYMTDKAETYKKVYKFLVVFQVIIVIINFTGQQYFVREGILGVFLAVLHYIIQDNLSYQIIIIDIFISLYFSIRFLLFFLQPFQNKANI